MCDRQSRHGAASTRLRGIWPTGFPERCCGGQSVYVVMARGRPLLGRQRRQLRSRHTGYSIDAETLGARLGRTSRQSRSTSSFASSTLRVLPHCSTRPMMVACWRPGPPCSTVTRSDMVLQGDNTCSNAPTRSVANMPTTVAGDNAIVYPESDGTAAYTVGSGVRPSLRPTARRARDSPRQRDRRHVRAEQLRLDHSRRQAGRIGRVSRVEDFATTLHPRRRAPGSRWSARWTRLPSTNTVASSQATTPRGAGGAQRPDAAQAQSNSPSRPRGRSAPRKMPLPGVVDDSASAARIIAAPGPRGALDGPPLAVGEHQTRPVRAVLLAEVVHGGELLVRPDRVTDRVERHHQLARLGARSPTAGGRRSGCRDPARRTGPTARRCGPWRRRRAAHHRAPGSTTPSRGRP